VLVVSSIVPWESVFVIDLFYSSGTLFEETEGVFVLAAGQNYISPVVVLRQVEP